MASSTVAIPCPVGTWTLLADGAIYESCTLQLSKSAAVAIAISNAPPAALSDDFFSLWSGSGEEPIPLSTTDRVYGRGLSTDGKVRVMRRTRVGASTQGIAATRGQAATLLQGAAAAIGFTFKKEYWTSPQAEVSNLVCLDVGWYINDSNLIVAIPAAITIKRYWEYPAGVFTPVTWAGAATAIIAADTTTVLKSDPCPIKVPASTRIWTRTVNVSAATRQFPLSQLPAVPTIIGTTDGSDGTDKGNTGEIPPSSASVGTFGPIAVLGDIGAANARSFIVEGDSLVVGSGDITSSGPRGSSGWIARKLDLVYPSVRFAKGGISAQALATSANRTPINAVLAQTPYTDAIVCAGTNDLSGLSQTVAQTLASLQLMYGKYVGKRVWQMTLGPRSTSSNSFADVLGQTERTDGTWALLDALNAAIRAVPAPLVGVVDRAAYAMSGLDSGLWGGPFPPEVLLVPTTDGTHEASVKAAAMAALWDVM